MSDSEKIILLEKRIVEQRKQLLNYQKLVKKQKKSLKTAVEKIVRQQEEIEILKKNMSK